MNDNFGILILVSDKTQFTAAYKLYNKLCFFGKRPLIFSLCDNAIMEREYTIRTLKYYQSIVKLDSHYIKQETYNLFYSLAEREIDNHLTLRTLTMYKGVALWDLSAVSVFPKIASIVYYINIMEAIFDFEKIKEIHIINNTSDLEKIARLICEKKQIPYFIENTTAKWILALRGFFLGNFIFLRKAKRMLISLYFLFINFKKSFRLKNSYKVIFFSPLERFFNSMLPVIRQYTEDERLVVNNFQSGSDKILIQNKIPYMDFYGYKLYSLFDGHVIDLIKKIKVAIYRDGIFFSKITYKQLPIGSLLSDLFNRVIHEEFPERMREVDILRKIILSYSPKVIVVTDCFSHFILIAKSLNISVVAIQTGHADEFIFFGPVKADAITVDGKYWKEYLSKKNVDADRIWVTGPPQFDLLQNNIFARKNDNFPLNIDKNKKIVVYASIYSSLALGMLDYERTEQVYLVFNAIKRIKDAHLIIKLHPYDFDSGIYSRAAKEIGLFDYSIIGNIDMLKVLKSCDLLITHLSKASYEAVLMNKNVLLLCYNSDFISDDIWDFKRYGAVMSAQNFSELEGCIRKALFDPATQFLLRKNRAEYIPEHVYKLDGNASRRVKEIIDRFCNNLQ